MVPIPSQLQGCQVPLGLTKIWVSAMFEQHLDHCETPMAGGIVQWGVIEVGAVAFAAFTLIGIRVGQEEDFGHAI